MKPRGEYVYFLRPVGKDGPVKIGYSKSPDWRLRDYAKWSPVPLELAATIAGDRKIERRFHAMFVSDHSHHEWFHASDLMGRTIAAIQAGAFDLNLLPDGCSLEGEIPRKAHYLIAGLSLRLGHVAKSRPIPSAVDKAFRRMTVANRDKAEDVFDDAETVWRFLERVAPRPRSKTTRLMQQIVGTAA